MVRLHCGDGPLRPDLVGLRDSVSALCADNERLERLLEDDLKEANAARHGEPPLEVDVGGPIKGAAGGPSTYQGPR